MSSIRIPWRVAALAAASAALALPTAAQAAPKFQQATFVVSAKLSQTTTWQGRPMATTADCVPLTRYEGEGSETVSATLKRWKLVAYRAGRQLGLTPARGSDPMGPTVNARVKRTASERVIELAGSCAGNPGAVHERGPYDCGDRNRPQTVTFTWHRGRFSVGLAPSILVPLTKTRYDSCPLRANPAVAQNGFTQIWQALPAADLFDPGLRKHIVLARKTFPLKEAGFTGRTVVRWEVTLTRQGKIR